MTRYTIQGNGHTVHVAGTIRQDCEVIVNYDGEQYVFEPDEESIRTNVVDAKILCDMPYIKEGSASQEIYLPNGVTIEKNAVKKELRTPDGNVIRNIQENSGDTIEGDGRSTNALKSAMSRVLSDTVEGDSTITLCLQSESQVSHNTSSNTDIDFSEDKSEQETKRKISKEELISSLVLGFSTILLAGFGLIVQSQIFLLISVLLYLVLSVPILFRFVLERITVTEEELREDNSVDSIKQQYREGEIDEEELEKMIEEEMVEHEERSLSTEKV